MKYNPRLPDLTSLVKKHMTLLYTDPSLMKTILQGSINQFYLLTR